MSGPLLRDANWVRQAFLVTAKDMEALSVQNRTETSASYKFTDTTPGGNFAINAPPQFTRFADPKATIPVTKNNKTAAMSPFPGSRGMGRYYSEAIDDNEQLIHMRFGVPQFNSLTTFFTGFYNSGAGQLARTGRGEGAMFTLGKAVGFVASIVYWPLLVANVLGNGYRFFLMKPSSKFYYLKPTMPVYWNAVQTMVNQIAVNRGIIPRVGGEDKARRFGEPFDFDDNALALLAKKMPDIFQPGGGIDVFALANRAQRLASKKRRLAKQILDVDNIDDLGKRIAQLENSRLDDKKPVFSDYLQRWFKTGAGAAKKEDGKTDVNTEQADISATAGDGLLSFLEAELNDGGAFATFSVNYTGSVGESFSSQAGESDIASKINSMSSSSRSTNFNFANGNLVGGVAGDVLGSIAGGVKNFLSGAAEGLNISGVAALGGAAFVDIPQHWQSSTAQLQRANYTVQLRSWSGDPISQLLNLHIPLCMLLAGALPLSTGRHSYTSPFILELYDQGRCQTRLGMIDSMTVTRGVGNLGFNNEGTAMGIDVSFSVIDLSTIMHMPISEGMSWSAAAIGGTAGAVVGGVAGTAAGGPVGTVVGAAGGAAVGTAVGAGIDAISAIGAAIKGAFSDDTMFTDYMATLSGLGVADQIYSWRKLKLNTTRSLANLNSFTSAAHFAAFMGDAPPARLLSALYKGTER